MMNIIGYKGIGSLDAKLWLVIMTMIVMIMMMIIKFYVLETNLNANNKLVTKFTLIIEDVMNVRPSSQLLRQIYRKLSTISETNTYIKEKS